MGKSCARRNQCILAKSILHSVPFVANIIQSNKAVLLPQVSRFFLENYISSSNQISLDNDKSIINEEGTVTFNSRWMLYQLKLHLYSHLVHKCIHKKYGTILYRKDGDLLTSLSWALGTNSFEAGEEFTSNPQHNCPDEIIVSRAREIINNLILSETMKQSNSKYPQMLDINKEISQINPTLWSFIESIAKSGKQRHADTSNNNKRVKMLRHYYLYCLLLYCTNAQKPLRLHLILADTIERSLWRILQAYENLMKIFNQLGAVCSPDTHDRFVSSYTAK